MLRTSLLLAATLCVSSALTAQEPSVRVEPLNLQGPRVLNDQTRNAVIKDYIEGWASLRKAMSDNRPDLLDRDFVGTAKDQLVDSIHQQVTSGMATRYLDRSHDLQIVFYSPEGLSVQLTDTVAYEVQLLSQGKVISTQQEQTKYVVVMTPSEVRWRIRILQGQSSPQ